MMRIYENKLYLDVWESRIIEFSRCRTNGRMINTYDSYYIMRGYRKDLKFRSRIISREDVKKGRLRLATEIDILLFSKD